MEASEKMTPSKAIAWTVALLIMAICAMALGELLQPGQPRTMYMVRGLVAMVLCAAALLPITWVIARCVRLLKAAWKS